MKRRLNIAVGLLHEPKVLYMDEPTVGIDPQSRRRILDTIQELNQEGMTVLYTTHYMEEAEELSNRIGIIDHGNLIAVGSQAELTKQVGTLDTVRLQFNSNLGQQELQGHLAAIHGVKNVVMDENGAILQVEKGQEILPALIETTNSHNFRLRGIDIQEPNLEALFLHLTGRALRD
jgi:ABC-2 type transport system ATP-binding protein